MNKNTKPVIAILDPLVPATREKLAALMPTGFDIVYASERSIEHLKALIAHADYAVSGQTPVPGELLRAATRLRLLHKWGVGVDNFDLDTARELNIPVARTTASNAAPVAEYALGLMIATMRSLAFGHAELQQGRWRGFPLPRDSLLISGKTVGIIGFGAIGQRLAQLLSGFGCRVLYNKRTPLPPDEEASLNAEFADLPTLLDTADIVSLNCPLTDQTAGMINRDALQRMKSTAILVNVARGGIVLEDDLYWALKNRVIHAAATDVFETEPLSANSPLLTLDNLVATPHLAALAADSFAPTVKRIAANIERVARGEAIPEFERVVR
ncbi:MAG: 2-hydroxyacid dehydrogenase [Burkholderiaceae bacterium]